MSVGWSWPGIVRISIVNSARSGTEFRLMPPLIVPTLRVGAPSKGWGVASKLKRSSLAMALAALLIALTPR